MGRPRCIPSAVEPPTVTIVPPFSTNFFNSGTVFAMLTLPTHDWYSAGRFAGTPPPPPPNPPPPSPAGMAPSGKISTSNFALRLPASRACANTTSNGNLNCSNSHRVQPESIDPPNLSQRPMRTGLSFNASPAGLVATASEVSPSSATSFFMAAAVAGFAVTYIVPAG